MQSKDHNKCPKAIKMEVEASQMKSKPIKTVSNTASQLPEIKGPAAGGEALHIRRPPEGGAGREK